jgi:hypothetical protein
MKTLYTAEALSREDDKGTVGHQMVGSRSTCLSPKTWAAKAASAPTLSSYLQSVLPRVFNPRSSTSPTGGSLTRPTRASLHEVAGASPNRH